MTIPGRSAPRGARLVRLRVRDRPGSLAVVTGHLAAHGVDVLSLEVLTRESGFAIDLREALEARKAIERAKGILMAKEGLTEAEAFERLRRASQRSGRPMKVIADAVTATLG